MSSDLLKEAIADAKAVRETALQNAKMALEEAFTPQLKSMLSAKLKEDEIEESDPVVEDDEMDDEDDAEEGRMSDGEHDDEEAEEGMHDDEAEEGRGDMEEDDDDDEEAEEGMHDEDDDMEEDLDLEAIIRELESELSEGEDEDEDEAEEGRGMKESEEDAVEESEEPVEEEYEIDESALEEEEELEEVDKSSDIGKGDNNRGNTDVSSGIGKGAKLKEVQSELKEYKEAVGYLKNKLHEVNILNAKLLFTNKLFKEFADNFRSLSEEEAKE